MKSLPFHALSLVAVLVFAACAPARAPVSETAEPSPAPTGVGGTTPAAQTPVLPIPTETPRPTPTSLAWWRPSPGLTWQWELAGNEINTSIKADVYDVDLYAEQSAIDRLRAGGHKVICYISVGSYEDWRPDRDRFPAQVLGRDYEGWPGEKWLDIRRIDLLAPIMSARFDLCRQKGFDAVEPDNMEAYTNDTGFPLTYQHQLAYARWLAEQAHARGLAIGIKNAPDQVADLLPYFDFAIVEDCFAYGWCDDMKPLVDEGKPVFAVEYTDMEIDFASACKVAKRLGLSMILKERELNAWRETCP